MSYLEQLKKLYKPTIPADISDKRPSVPFVSTYESHISANKDTSVPFVSTYQRHIPENQFLADSQIKRNQDRCSDCINLYPCPSARNINGECPSDFEYGITITGKDALTED